MSRGNHVLEARCHEAGTQGDCTFTKAKSRYKVPQTSEEQESYPTKGASDPGRAEPSQGMGSSARPDPSSARGRAQAQPGRAPPSSAWFDCFLLERFGSFDDRSRSFQDPFKTVSSTDPTHYYLMKARLKWSHQWGCSPDGNPH